MPPTQINKATPRVPIKKIADLTSAEITGTDELTVSQLAKIDEAAPGDLTFLYLPAYEKFFADTKASAIFVRKGFLKSRDDITYLEVEDPNIAFFKTLITFFSPQFPLRGISPSAFIAASAVIEEGVSIGENVVIGANCVIGKNTKIFHNCVISENVCIGDDCLIFPNVTLREEVILGNRIILHPGVVIGSDGFGYFQNDKKEYQKIPQIGNVILEDDVEVGANSTIDRAALGSTLIKRGSRIDNLVQIAHNVVVGEHTVISAQTGIAGSSRIGDHCVLAGQVGITGHVTVGDNIVIAAQSGVTKSLQTPGVYFGSPAKEHKTALRSEGYIRGLPKYVERITDLEKKIAELEAKVTSLTKDE
jgi:UDP-3-O-[3-hydroxymyristoyl] glucosamine N-acyltransferase